MAEPVNTSCPRAAAPAKYEFPPRPLTVQEKSEFVRSWCSQIKNDALTDLPCGVCAQLKKKSVLRPVSLDDPCLQVLYSAAHDVLPACVRDISGPQEVLYRPAINMERRQLDACSICVDWIRKRKRLPTVSLSNGMWLGDLPVELERLTWMEQTMIAKHRHNVCVVSVNVSKQRKMQANAVIFAQPVSYVRLVVPPPPEEIDDCVIAMFTGPCKPTAEDLRRTPLLFRRGVFLRALEWLRTHNPLYSDVELSITNLNKYVDGGIPLNIVYRESDGSVALEAMPVHQSIDRSVQTGTCPLTVCGVLPDNVLQYSHTDRGLLALKHLRSGGPVLGYGHSDEPESMFSNPDLYPALFPWLYPYGYRGFGNGKSTYKIPLAKHIKFCLNYADRRFQKDYYFPFIVYSHRRIKCSSRGSYLLAKREHYESVVEKVLNIDVTALDSLLRRGKPNTYLEPANDAERRCFELIHLIDGVAGHVPGSNTQKKYQRDEAKSLMIEKGAPSLFVTFAPGDTASPICMKFCGVDVDLDPVVINLPLDVDREKQVAGNPVACAKFFHLMVTLFVNCLLRSGTEDRGLFGHTAAYYGTVESQGRQTLHLHCLVWITDALTPQQIRERVLSGEPEFRKRMVAWLEDCQRGEFANGNMETWSRRNDEKRASPGYVNPVQQIPRAAFPELSLSELQEWYAEVVRQTDELVFLLNRHSSAHERGCRRPPDFTCCARFPRDLVAESHVDEECGSIILKKLEAWLNTFNGLFTYLVRCNTDVTCLLSGTQVKAVIAYVTDYVTKMSLNTYTIFDVVRGVLDRNMDIVASSETRSDAARRLLSKMVNGISARIEVGAPMACSELLGHPPRYSDHCFKPFCWSSYLVYLDRTVSSSDPDDSIDDGDLREASVLIGRTSGGVGAVSKVHDYVYRSSELEDVSLSDFLRKYDVLKITDRVVKRGLDSVLDNDEDDQSSDEDSDADSSSFDHEPLRPGVNRAAVPDALRPRVQLDRSKSYPFMSAHGRYRTHGVLRLKPGYEYCLTYFGRRLPRRDADDKEMYCKVMLMLFNPRGWRSAADLKQNNDTWEGAFGSTQFASEDVRRMSNMHILYECNDARDDYAAQRRAEMNTAHDLPAFLDSEEVAKLDVERDQTDTIMSCTEGDVEKFVEAAYDYVGEEAARKHAFISDMSEKLNLLYDEAESLYGRNIEGPYVPKVFPTRLPSAWKALTESCKQQVIAARCGSVGGKSGVDTGKKSYQDAFRKNAQLRLLSANDLVNDPQFSTLRLPYSDDMDHIRYTISRLQLNEEQQRAFVLAATKLVKIRDGQLVMYVGGMAGSGKSTLIKALTSFLFERGESHRCEMWAPTGSAASVINGSTYHSALHLGREEELDGVLANVAKARTRLQRVDFIILDEVSMLSTSGLYRLSAQLSKVKSNTLDLFGGCHFMFCGDFAQLPPPGTRQYSLYSTRIGAKSGAHSAFTQRNLMGRALWHHVTEVVLLTRNMRQRGSSLGDIAFREALVNMRYGRCSPGDLALLDTRIMRSGQAGPHIGQTYFRNVSVITSWNVHRDALNDVAARRFASQHQTELTSFYSYDRLGTIEDEDRSVAASRRRHNQLVDNKVNKRQLTPAERELLWSLSPVMTDNVAGVLKLCRGMPVMLKHNEATEIGASNGAEGVVHGWDCYELYPGKLALNVLFVRLHKPVGDVAVDGLANGVVPVTADSHAVKCLLPNDKIRRISRKQVFVLPNFGMTDFACQGRDRPYNVVDLTHAKGHQSVYSSVSRSTAIEGTLILKEWTHSKVTKGISPDLEREFRHLEILNDITRRRYSGDLDKAVTGLTRGELVESYQRVYGIRHVPAGVHAALDWSSMAEKDLRAVDSVQPWCLVDGHRSSASKKRKSEHAIVSEPVAKKRRATKRVRFAGCKWDNRDWSCGYDCVVSFCSWLRQTDNGRWNAVHEEVDNMFVRMLASELDVEDNVNTVRNDLRDRLFEYDPVLFARQGHSMVSIAELLEVVFRDVPPYAVCRRTCQVCHHCTEVFQKTSLLWDVTSTVGLDDGVVLDEALLSQMLSFNRVRPCDICVGNTDHRVNTVLTRTPSLLFVNLPGIPSFIRRLKIQCRINILNVRWKVLCIFYWGSDHYTTRYIFDERVYYYDGMVGSALREERLDSTDLSVAGHRIACAIVYSPRDP